MSGFESYIAVPIFRPGGEYFGNVCALDSRPARLRDGKTLAMMNLFAELIAVQLAAEEEHARDRDALVDARRTAELREQFIAVLGHDLRNPLASIEAGVRIIAREPLGERALKAATLVQRSVGRMAGLIDNVPAITSAVTAAKSFLIDIRRASKCIAPHCGGSRRTLLNLLLLVSSP